MNNLSVFELERSFKTAKKKEMLNATESWLSIILIVAVVLLSRNNFAFSSDLVVLILVSTLAVSIAFIARELAHDFTAKFLGCDETEFKKSSRWFVVIGLLISLFGFIVIAPGVTVIKNTSKRKGVILMAVGILTNVVLAILFFVFAKFTNGKLSSYLMLGYSINASFAFFSALCSIAYFVRENFRIERKDPFDRAGMN